MAARLERAASSAAARTLPTLLVGAQPYGLLPVGLVAAPRDGAGGRRRARRARARRALELARGTGRLADVAAAGPGRARRAEDGTESEGEQAARGVADPGRGPAPDRALRLQHVDAERDGLHDRWARAGCGPRPGRRRAPPTSRRRARDDDYDRRAGLGASSSRLTRAALAAATTVSSRSRRSSTRRRRSRPPRHRRRSTRHRGAYYDDSGATTRASRWSPSRSAHADAHRAGRMARSTRRPGVTRHDGRRGRAGGVLHHPSGDGDGATGRCRWWRRGRSEADVAELAAWLDELATRSRRLARRRTTHEPLPLLRQLAALERREPATPATGEPHAARRRRARASTACARVARTAPRSGRRARAPAARDARRGRTGSTPGTRRSRPGGWRTSGRRAATGIQVGAYGLLDGRQAARAAAPRRATCSRPRSRTPRPPRSCAAAGRRSAAAARAPAWPSTCPRTASAARAGSIDGVRQGQDLGAAARRALRARPAERRRARPVDRRFRGPRSTPSASTAPPNAIVDGLLLARGRADARRRADDGGGGARGSSTTLLAGAGGDRAAALEAVLDSLAADLDAVADAAVAQSVFSLAQGNVPEATATLTAAATGEVAFPRAALRRHAAAGADGHAPPARCCSTRRRPAWPGAAPSGRALAAPALDAWVGGRCSATPAATASRCASTTLRRGAPLRRPGRRARSPTLGLAALDLVYLAPAGEQTGLGRLGAVLAALGRGPRPGRRRRRRPSRVVDRRGRPVARRPGRRLPGAAAAARRGARPRRARPREPGRHRGRQRASTWPSWRRAWATCAPRSAPARRASPPRSPRPGRPARGDVRGAMLALGGFELPGDASRGADPAALVAEADGAARRRSTPASPRSTRASPTRSDGWDGARRGRPRARAARPRCACSSATRCRSRRASRPPNGAELDATLRAPAPRRARGGHRLARRRRPGRSGRPAAAGRRRPGRGGARRRRCSTSRSASSPTTRTRAGRRPSVRRPTSAAGSACSPPATQPRLRRRRRGRPRARRLDRGRARGARRRPASRVHFDAPSARAPQAILLCTATREDAASASSWCATWCCRRSSWRRLRMVGPETLGGHGPVPPATYLHARHDPAEAP